MMETLYQTLGVNKDASLEEIKTAYRTKAKLHHPDKGGKNQKFTEINNAYSILSNPYKKDQYDKTGEVPEDNSPEQVIKLTAIKYISTMVIDLITKEINSENLIELMKRKSQEVKSNELSQIRKLSKSKRNIKKILNNLKFNGVGDDILTNILNSHITLITQQIKVHVTELKISRKILAILKNYSIKAGVDSDLVNYFTNNFSNVKWTQRAFD